MFVLLVLALVAVAVFPGAVQDPSDLYKVSVMRAQAGAGHAKARRLACGLSLRELASAIGCHWTTLRRWEDGESTPRPSAALAWWRALDGCEGRPS